MVGIRTFLRRTWGRVWIYSFFALLLMIALSFIQHVIGGINWEAFQYPAEDGKPNVFVDDINHPSELTSLLVGDNHLYLFYGRIDVVKVYDLDGQYLYSVNFRDGRDSGGPSYIYKLLNNLRTSAKNFLYAYANSAAMNGMNETSHVVHTTSWVETDMLIARIVLIVLTALFGLAMLVSYFMDVKKKAASADRKTLSIVAAVIAVLAAIFYIIIDTAATTKMNFDAVVLVLLLVSAVCYLVAGVKKIGLLAAAGLAGTLVAWFRYLVTEINFRMDDLVLIFGGTSTIGALGVPFILSFILMLLAVISGAVLMTGAMGSEKK